MKREIIIILISSLLIFSLAFLIFNRSSGLTGFVVSENSEIIDTNNSINSDSVLINVTKTQAILAINNSQNIIKEMQRYEFSIQYVNDSLTEAIRAFKQAEYVDIINNPNSTTLQKNEARKALSLINLKTVGYSNVLVYTKEIESRKQQAFEIYDLISIDQNSIRKYEARGINMDSSKAILNQVKTAFNQDQYKDAQDLLVKLREEIDSKSSEASVLGSLKNSTISFIQKNWYYLLVICLLLYVLIRIILSKFKLDLLKKKIKKLKTEQSAISDLIRTNQVNRYKEGKISGLIYNIRAKKYEDRLNQIKEELPVLEDNLKKILAS